ncbi:MAG: glutamate--cysteine ligase [Sandaracinaceae bacterium]|nr:glutamate--cysteine ligase [Sandaracinaceae bacterium]
MQERAKTLDFASLSQPFREAEKDASKFRIGTESEKFAVRPDGGPVLYDEPNGIVDLLKLLAARFGWEPSNEYPGGPILALKRDEASITLEPGGQFEISGAPFATLDDTAEEFSTHRAELEAVGRELGIVFLGLGFHPFATRAELPWVPKLRYPIMRDYLPTRGHRAHDMMQRTSTVQANLDYASEEDAMRKLKLALRVQPLLSVMFANSPFKEGKRGDYLSERADVWLHMDPDRSGIPAFAFTDALEYREYIEYALDVPMFIVKRGSEIQRATHLTFRQFLRDGLGEARATLEDWTVHLATLFPEARLKHIIEMRGIDAQNAELAVAASAFFKGLFYDSRSLDALEALLRGITREALEGYRRRAPSEGYSAELGGKSTREYAEALLDLADSGLRRLAGEGASERRFLEPIAELIRDGESPASRMLREAGDREGEELRRFLLERARF